MTPCAVPGCGSVVVFPGARCALHEPKASVALGRKYDAHKPRYGLVPPKALDLIVRVLTYGAEKYTVRDEDGRVVADGSGNWSEVEDGRRRYFDALMRHAWAYARGEENDPESGLPHLAHAGACVLFLLSELAGDPASKSS